MSLKNTRFGKYYTRDSTSNSNEIQAQVAVDEAVIIPKYRYGTRFRNEQSEEGDITIALCLPAGSSRRPGLYDRRSISWDGSHSVGKNYDGSWITPLTELSNHLKDSGLPVETPRREMIIDRAGGADRSALEGELCHEPSAPDYNARPDCTRVVCRSWGSTLEEMSAMDAALDLFYAP